MAPFRLFNDKLPGEKQRVLWTLRENMHLLDVISDLDVVQDLCMKKNQAIDDICEAISQRLRMRGCDKTGFQVRGRWTNIRRLYLTEKKRREFGSSSTPPYMPAHIFDAVTKTLADKVHLIEVNKTYRMVMGVQQNLARQTNGGTKSIDLGSPMTSSEDDCVILSSSEKPESAMSSDTDFYPLEVCLTILDEDVSDRFSDDPTRGESSGALSHRTDHASAGLVGSEPDVEVVDLTTDSEDLQVLFQSMPSTSRHTRMIEPSPSLAQSRRISYID